jgi:hypothetical protein
MGFFTERVHASCDTDSMLELVPWQDAFQYCSCSVRNILCTGKKFYSDQTDNGHDRALEKVRSQICKFERTTVKFLSPPVAQQPTNQPKRRAQPAQFATTERNREEEILGIDTLTHLCVRVAQPFNDTE